jgi:hypothetical protein
MGVDTVGKVVVAAKIENLEDIFSVRQGRLAPDQVRMVEVTDAVVDTRTTGLMIPTRLLASLGLRPTRILPGRTVSGSIPVQMYEAVRLTVQGRDCVVNVHEISDPSPVLIGQVPLGALDWVVDPVNRRLIGNPDHGGRDMVDALVVSG